MSPPLRLLRVGLLAASVLACSPVHADFDGKVGRVVDGDTLVVFDGQRHRRVRLADIDAPEDGQAFSSRSRQALADLVEGQQVQVVEAGTDRYGRTLGVVMIRGCRASGTCIMTNVNVEMVRSGMAWAYRHNGKPTDPAMPPVEQEAREARRGLWADADAQEPGAWRRERRPTP